MPCIIFLYNFKSKDYKKVIYKFVIFNLFIQKMQEQSTSLCDTKYKIVFLGNMGVGNLFNNKRKNINNLTLRQRLI